MKNLLLELKEAVIHYSTLKNKKEMGASICLSDIEKRPINHKVKKLIRKK